MLETRAQKLKLLQVFQSLQMDTFEDKNLLLILEVVCDLEEEDCFGTEVIFEG